MGELLVGVGIVFGLGVFFAVVLAAANRKLRVEEDPRIDTVESLLPGANCGACGAPGCRAFAELLVARKAPPAKCTVSPQAGIEAICDFLGVAAGGGEKHVARLLCAGGKNEAHQTALYEGLRSCRAAAAVAAGAKGCIWGCLGLGDCVRACTFDAMHLNADRLPVVDVDRCTACGDCVEACPKDLLVLMPLSHKLLVQCKSLLGGEEAEALCSVACNGCGRCAADAPDELIRMENDLAVVDYTRHDLATPAVTRRCPTGAIVWVEGRQFAAPPREPLPVGGVDVEREEGEG